MTKMKAGDMKLEEFNKTMEHMPTEKLLKGADVMGNKIDALIGESSDLNIDGTLTPIANGVIIAFIGVKTTGGGLTLTGKEADADEPQYVLAVGPMVKDIKPKSWVIIRNSARPDSFLWRGKRYLFFREHDILVNIQGDPKDYK
jgi:co-chaperonin GroES (HSP10)